MRFRNIPLLLLGCCPPLIIPPAVYRTLLVLLEPGVRGPRTPCCPLPPPPTTYLSLQSSLTLLLTRFVVFSLSEVEVMVRAGCGCPAGVGAPEVVLAGHGDPDAARAGLLAPSHIPVYRAAHK